MTVRFHLFPFRTQKLSSLVPKIVGWKRPVKIGRCRLLFYYGPLVKRLRQRPLTPLTWVRFPHGSPKNAPQLRLGSFFGASVRGIEQDGRPQAAKNNPADCFLVRGRWTHGSPKRYLARSCGVFFIAVFRGGNARAEGQALKGEVLRSAV